MTDLAKWHWNEFQQVGTDYASPEEVAVYDNRMRQFRDIDGENRAILNLLKLPQNANVLEIGVGTGAFLQIAAPVCANVVGLDVSTVMLEYTRQQLQAKGLTNTELHNAGFLTYDYPTSYFDGIVSGMAFHHLPDTWKAVALRKIFASLKPGGRFILLDVVFDWGTGSPDDYFDKITSTDSPAYKTQLQRHIAQEYSTLTWIMEGLFEHAGFVIESHTCAIDFIHTYCVRKPD